MEEGGESTDAQGRGWPDRSGQFTGPVTGQMPPELRVRPRALGLSFPICQVALDPLASCDLRGRTLSVLLTGSGPAELGSNPSPACFVA